MIDSSLDPDDAQAAMMLKTLTGDLTPLPVILNPDDPANPVNQDKLATEDLFGLLEQHHFRPKELTEFELYARLETLKTHGPNQSA